MNPAAVDLRPLVDQVENQGTVGMCVAEGIHKAVEVAYERNGGDLKLSPAYLYYYARELEKFPSTEGIKTLGDAATVLQSRGCCLESSYPSTTNKQDIKPPAALDAEAAEYKIQSWHYLSVTLDTIKTCLAQGMCVPIGMALTEDFYSLGDQKNWRESHWNPIGDRFKNPFVGEHAVMIIGYDDAVGRFLVQNSWGPAWADGGFFGLPYASIYNCIVQCLVIDKLGVPFVNAGWTEEPIVTFDRLMDWAEKTYGLAHMTTQRFAQYLYRTYGDVSAGLDMNRGMIVKYTASTNTMEDFGLESEWLDKINLS
jgi:hypothetical protein